MIVGIMNVENIDIVCAQTLQTLLKRSHDAVIGIITLCVEAFLGEIKRLSVAEDFRTAAFARADQSADLG